MNGEQGLLKEIFDRLPSVADVIEKDQENSMYISKTLVRLPKSIRERVLEEVAFVHTAARGTVSRVLFRKDIESDEDLEEIKKGKCVFIEQSLIILNLKYVKNTQKMDVIAHEIAHYVLGHDDPYHTGTWQEDERAADDLAERWGFNRSYKDYRIR